MRLLICLALAITTSASLIAQDAAPAAPAAPTLEASKLATPRDRVSYAIGLSIGRNIKQQGLPLNVEMIALGIKAILEGAEPLINQEEIQAASKEFDAEIEAEALKPVAKFLADNAMKEGVKTTESGLQYLVIKAGAGATPTATNTVSTHYRGKLMDGSVFDESYEGDAPTAGDKPVEFGVGQVIKGWTEALQLMKAGAKYRLFIPPGLAYGKNGPPSIGPNKLLIFDIELLEVK
jgi:FKBP-type peptidyl-prolyl cis-trans isomerase FklB